MIGIVLVSHSRALADALVDLVRQVSTADVSIAIAAGVGCDRLEFGTDAIELMEAIQSVYTEDGVLVLMDLGSAVLSAQMALDLLPPGMNDKIRFCGAPIVEGAIAAAVQSGLDSDLDTICREASSALAPKREQLGEAPAEAVAPVAAAPHESSESITLTLTNLHGLHARPAAKFVQAAAAFESNVAVTDLTNGKGPVSARSLNSIATLGAVEYHQIRIDASGPEAGKALETLRALAEANFGEAPAGVSLPAAKPVAAEAVSSEGNVRGAIPVSEGIAIGPFFRYQPPVPPIPQDPSPDPAAEWARLEKAIESTRAAIRERRRQLRGTLSDADAAIFEAHELLLQDPEMLAQVRERIEKDSRNAAAAFHAVMSAQADQFRALDDSYLQARAAD